MGGRHTTGLRDVFQGGGSYNTPIWVGDVGDYPPHGQVPGYFSEQIRQADYRETAKATGGWELGVPTAGYIYGGGGFLGDGRICPEEAEYSRTVHCDAADFGPLQGYGADIWVVGC